MGNVDGFCHYGLIDTINFYVELDSWQLVNTGVLTEVRNVTDEKTGAVIYHTGRLRNLIVQWDNASLRVKGSLAKYYFGDNFYLLNRQEVEKVIEKLSQQLGVELGNGITTRIDLASNFEVPIDVESYFSFFGYKNYHCRNYTGLNSLYYSNSCRKTIIYDKKLEMARDGLFADSILGNLMRIEVRYRSKYINAIMDKTFSRKKLLLRDIYDKSIFAFFIKQWNIEYFDINRENSPLFDLSKLEGPSKIAEVLAREGIVALGGVNQVLQIIEKSNSILPSPYPAFATRVKSTVKKIASDSTYTVNNSYMIELDNKVRQYVDYFLHLNESLP